MAFNIGLNVVEVDGKGAPAIAGAATSVAAFNITTRRGVANRPVRVTSFKQFADQFGGFTAGSLGGYMVRGFFENGGQNAYINRIVADGARGASLAIKDVANQNTLTLTAGYRGKEDPGAWGSDLYAKAEAVDGLAVSLKETEAASITGSAITEPLNMTALSKLSLKVDGETAEITFVKEDFGDVTKATLAEIRDAINQRAGGRATASIVTAADTRLRLVSNGATAHLNRQFTTLEVTANNATLGFTAVAVSGKAAAFGATTTTLTSAEAFAPGEAIRISDGNAATTVAARVVRANPDTGVIEWAPAVANANAFDGAKTKITKLEFNLTIALGGKETSNIVETFRGLSMEKDAPNYAVSILGDELSGSKFVLAASNDSASGVGQNRPRTTASGFDQFTRIRDVAPTPQDFIGDDSKSTGFYAFDPADVQLVACERSDPAITAAGLAYCANRGDCMYIASVPQKSVGEGKALAYGQSFQGKKVYGAAYGPWLKVVDPRGSGDNPYIYVPPAGHVMGIYARIETTRGIWKAPAGDEAAVMGAVDIEHQLSDADHTDLVVNGSVNGIRAIRGAGIVVDASRTLSTDTRWLYVNVRLLFNYVKSSLKNGLRWVRQEPNRDTLWNTVKFNAVQPFLMGLWRQGAFGTGQPAEVFSIVCDAGNNTPDQVDLGIFKIEVYFYPSKPAETIIIVVGQQPSGASASEA